ncbi:MAG: hypothetical protein JO240_18450, partial [Solirubrobacterales bacterium]|nr:hypothetical protein [Solirubrobacterales bacterium]
LDPARREAALVALAVAQHAVVGLDQLRKRGFTARAIQQRAGCCRLHRIYRGVYSLVPRELLTRNGHYMAAVLACGPAPSSPTTQRPNCMACGSTPG